MTALSSTQVDALGNRIRRGDLQPGDDDMLAAFLLSLGAFSEETEFKIVAALIDAQDRIDPRTIFITERTMKSSQSIADKLRRQPTLRLDQLQDIVGCRILTPNVETQDAIASLLKASLADCDLKDRRQFPTHGYRAIHLIARSSRLRYEVQIRTTTQHIWATLVERLIGRYGVEIKYGGGPAEIQQSLQDLSLLIDEYETGDNRPGDIVGSEIRKNLDEFNSLLGQS